MSKIIALSLILSGLLLAGCAATQPVSPPITAPTEVPPIQSSGDPAADATAISQDLEQLNLNSDFPAINTAELTQ